MRQFAPLLLASVHAIDLTQPGWNTIGGMGMGEMMDNMPEGGMPGMVDEYWPTNDWTNSTNSTDQYPGDDSMMPPLSTLYVDGDGMAWNVDVLSIDNSDLLVEGVVIDVAAAMGEHPELSSGSSGFSDVPSEIWVEVKEVWNYEEDDEEPIAQDLHLLIANPDAGSDDWTEDGTDDGTEGGTDDGTEEGTGSGGEDPGMDGQEGYDCYM